MGNISIAHGITARQTVYQLTDIHVQYSNYIGIQLKDWKRSNTPNMGTLLQNCLTKTSQWKFTCSYLPVWINWCTSAAFRCECLFSVISRALSSSSWLLCLKLSFGILCNGMSSCPHQLAEQEPLTSPIMEAMELYLPWESVWQEASTYTQNAG